MTTGDAWDGKERRENATEELVTRAATHAAQRVGQIHRRRLVVQSFLAALVVSTAVAVTVALIVNHHSSQSARANSTYNCATLTKVSDLFAAFLTSDAHLRYRQQHYRERQRVLSNIASIGFDLKLLTRIQKASDDIDLHARRFWTMRLAPAFRQLATVNCDAALDDEKTKPTVTLPGPIRR